MKKKISTVKSIGGSRCLDNAKYLDWSQKYVYL
jgi:hypothetical protein